MTLTAMVRHMWGGHNRVAGYSCDGCGFSEETRDGGASWVTKNEIGGREVKRSAQSEGNDR